MDKPFAITLDPGSSLANKTGSWRTFRPVYLDRLPPCNAACPAGENIQGWLYHAESGDYEQAWRALTENNPLPAIMGRVCYHPCQGACNRQFVDSAVGINAVERFLGDEAIKRGWAFGKPTKRSGKRVLVVGAGPSGLSAAYHLARYGHAVEIHEAGPFAGGMMRFGIPKYRLPREVIEAEVQRMVQDAELHAEEDRKAHELAEARNQCDGMIHTVKKSLAEYGKELSDSEKQVIEKAMQEAEEAIRGNDIEAIKAKNEALGTAAQKLGEKMYAKQQEQTGGTAHAAGAAGEAKKDDSDVVDAEFTEVKDKK